MNNELVKTIKSISSLTEELIKTIESNDFSKLEYTLDKRQKEIDSLHMIGCTKEQYRSVEKSFELDNLQQKLFKLMEQKRSEIKEKLDVVTKNKFVTNSYNHHNTMGSKIFSKKI